MTRWCRTDAIVLVCLISLALAFTLPLRAFCQEKKDERVECANHLKQIALGAMQYADDKRFYPHLGPLTKLDNEGSTKPAGNPVPPRCLRSLMYFNYLDDPQVFVCPSSADKAAPMSAEAQKDPRKFLWAGNSAEKVSASPIASPAVSDGDADALTDLSYGWTLRGLTTNSVSTSLVAADRARRVGKRTNQKIEGNHEAGFSVAHLDAHVSWVKAGPKDDLPLSSNNPSGGCLVVWDDANFGDAPRADTPKVELPAFCVDCGRKFEVDARFCAGCGKPRKGAAPKEEAAVNPWRTLAVGSSLEYEVKTHLAKPMVSDTNMTMKQTLVAKDDQGYTLKTQMMMNGANMPAGEPTTTSWATAPTKADAPKLEGLGTEKLTTPAGVFECKKSRVEITSNGVTTTSTLWMAEGILVKTESATEGQNMSCSTSLLLTKFDKK